MREVAAPPREASREVTSGCRSKAKAWREVDAQRQSKGGKALEAGIEVEAEVTEAEWGVERGKVGRQVDPREDQGQEAQKTAQVLRLPCGISF